jgi:hypothetical protein
MSTVTDPGYPTLLNVVKRMKPDGSVETMLANTLTKKLPMLQDIPWVEGNLPTGHRISAVNALPSPTWRKLNQGLAATKAATVQYDESCGMLEAYAKVDKDLANLNGNAAAYRESENRQFLEAFNQEASRAIFYESITSHPERIHGLSARYAATSGYTASSYVLKPGTVGGSNAHSVWLICWDQDKVFGIYPKASVAGLVHEDLGQQLVLDASSNQFLAYVSRFQWKFGIAVKDYRYACRMQWDPDDTAGGFGPTGTQLYVSMSDMLTTVFELTPNAAFYMDRTSYKLLNDQVLSNEGRPLQTLGDGAVRLPGFMGIPIRFTDTLTAETAIS